MKKQYERLFIYVMSYESEMDAILATSDNLTYDDDSTSLGGGLGEDWFN